MKKLSMTIVAGIAVIVFAGGFTAYAEEFPPSCNGQPPHYLRGLTPSNDQIETFQQMGQVFFMSVTDSVVPGPRGSNLGEQMSMTFYGHTLTLYLPMYRVSGDIVYYLTGAGATKLTTQEFQCVKDDLYAWIKAGIDRDFADHQMLSGRAIARFAERIEKTPDEVRAMLAMPIPEFQTNYGDVFSIPLLEPVDFIGSVKHVYFTSLKSCNAAVLLKSILMLTPCMRRYDYVLGYPQVMKHELIHANVKLQGYPMGNYINMELMAAFLPFLEHPVAVQTFFYHTYLSAPWEVTDVMTGFDIEKVRNEIFRYQLMGGGLAFNREVFEKYLPEINRVSQWLRESALKMFVEYYSDQHFWAAVNESAHDDEMMYKVIMAKLYEPVKLGGHANTIKFILKHAEQSADVARKALERVDKPMPGGYGPDSDAHARLRKEFADVAALFGMTPEMIDRLGRVYGIRGIDFERADPEVLRTILHDFVNREGIFQVLQEVK